MAERPDRPTRAARALSGAFDRADVQRTGREAVIYSPRWRTPLVVDLVLGTVVLAGGLALAIAWNPLVGGGIGALGGLYASLAVRRWRLWAGLRRAAGDGRDGAGPRDDAR